MTDKLPIEKIGLLNLVALGQEVFGSKFTELGRVTRDGVWGWSCAFRDACDVEVQFFEPSKEGMISKLKAYGAVLRPGVSFE